MGFFKKITKSVGNVVKKITKNPIVKVLNPVGAFGTDLAMSGINKASGIDDATYPQASTTGNPAIDRLYDMKPFDYLKDTSLYAPLKDTSKYSFLKSADNGLGDSSFLDVLKNPTAIDRSKQNTAFDSLISSIDAPSSVDDVRGELDNERLGNLLTGIDIDTKGTLGGLKADYADRGLGGPGMISDIEANALAQARGDSDRRKSDARLSLATAELDRLKAREDARRAAYASRYQTEAASDTQDANTKNSMLSSWASLLDSRQKAEASNKLSRDVGYADLLKSADENYVSSVADANKLWAELLNQRQIAATGQAVNSQQFADEFAQKYKDPGLFDKLLDKINIGIGI